MSVTPPSHPSFAALINGTDALTEVFPPPRSRAGEAAPDAAARGAEHAQPGEGWRNAASDEAIPAEPERVIARFRPHGRRLFFPSVFLVALAGATGYFGGWFHEPWQNQAVFGGALLLGILFFFVPLIRWLCTRYTLTTRRIIFRRGLLVNTRSELMLSRAHDVTVRKAGLQALFRSGDVRVGTGPGEYVVLKDVPQAALVLSVLGDLLEAQHLATAAHVRRHEREDDRWQQSRG